MNHPPTVLVWGPEDVPCSCRCPFAQSEGQEVGAFGTVSSCSRGERLAHFLGARCCLASARSGAPACAKLMEVRYPVMTPRDPA